MIPTVLIVVVVGFLILRFIFKPLFKILAFAVLALIAWWFLKGF
jgi:hypothetical protein